MIRYEPTACCTADSGGKWRAGQWACESVGKPSARQDALRSLRKAGAPSLDVVLRGLANEKTNRGPSVRPVRGRCRAGRAGAVTKHARAFRRVGYALPSVPKSFSPLERGPAPCERDIELCCVRVVGNVTKVLVSRCKSCARRFWRRVATRGRRSTSPRRRAPSRNFVRVHRL